MAHPVIALITDFGTKDHYVGAIRGAILAVCSDVTIADITHEIAPQDVLGGALELGAVFQYFPAGTVFLAVVDPGVGSARRGIAAHAGGFTFVAPDNGLLTMVFRRQRPTSVVELTDGRYARPTISRTFEGRDRFAPAAAWLATGTALTALGPPLADYQLLNIAEPRVGDGLIAGEVLRVDRFGNLITNIDRRTADGLAAHGAITVAAGGHTIPGLVATYAEADGGSTCALFGSSDQLEIAVVGGSAAARLNLGRGAPVTVTRS